METIVVVVVYGDDIKTYILENEDTDILRKQAEKLFLKIISHTGNDPSWVDLDSGYFCDDSINFQISISYPTVVTE